MYTKVLFYSFSSKSTAAEADAVALVDRKTGV